MFFVGGILCKYICIYINMYFFFFYVVGFRGGELLFAVVHCYNILSSEKQTQAIMAGFCFFNQKQGTPTSPSRLLALLQILLQLLSIFTVFLCLSFRVHLFFCCNTFYFSSTLYYVCFMIINRVSWSWYGKILVLYFLYLNLNRTKRKFVLHVYK